jgi:hypothetical protein
LGQQWPPKTLCHRRQDAIHTTFGESSELVGCCDVNEGRLRVARDAADTAKRPAPALYAATDFDRMLKETRPDVVFVTTVDFNSWEGYYVIFNGTKGRLEHKVEEGVYVSGDSSVDGAIKGDGTYIRIYPLRDAAYAVKVWTGAGSHGGGDAVMLQEIFGSAEPDKYLRASDQRAGAYSCLTGIAANRSIATGQPVRVADLVSNIGYPDFPKMPSHDEPVPMPTKR